VSLVLLAQKLWVGPSLHTGKGPVLALCLAVTYASDPNPHAL